MAQTPKVKGPASYFPSIEKTYGKPVAHWMEILKRAGELRHMALVIFLKTEHQMGHGHSNALVAHFLGAGDIDLESRSRWPFSSLEKPVSCIN